MSHQSDTTLPGSDLAITGVGVISAAGAGARAFREAHRSGTAGLRTVARLADANLPLAVGGEVTEEVVDAAIGERADGLTGRLHRMCFCAAEEALRDGGFSPGKGTAGFGIALGTALADVEALEMPAGPHSPPAFHYELTASLAEDLGLTGPRWSFSMTCTSGLGALDQAACDIRLGRAPAMLVGGADLLSRFMQAGFCALRALSPSGKLFAFDRRHDGIVLGEGAAFVLLEPLERARRRGARAYGIVAGSRLTGDASHLTSPDASGAGMAEAILGALEEAALAPDAIGAVSVTATGSPIYDRMQARALRAAFGEAAERTAVTSWEGATGHALASTAVLGLIHAAQTVREGTVLPVGTIAEPDPESGLPYVEAAPAPLRSPAVLALTVGFGGQNGATVVRSAEKAV